MPPDGGAVGPFPTVVDISSRQPPAQTPLQQHDLTKIPNNCSGGDGLAEVLVDDNGKPYNLGPKGFVCDLNTRAVKIARRVRAQALAAERKFDHKSQVR